MKSYLAGSNTLRAANRASVIPTKMMSNVDADLDIPVLTVFTAGAIVGIGRGVGVAGGGSTHSSPVYIQLEPEISGIWRQLLGSNYVCTQSNKHEA